jgi:hypothetical protein
MHGAFHRLGLIMVMMATAFTGVFLGSLLLLVWRLST